MLARSFPNLSMKVKPGSMLQRRLQRFLRRYRFLHHPMSAMEISSKQEAIQDDIQRAGLSRLSGEDLTDLKEPLLAEEVTMARV